MAFDSVGQGIQRLIIATIIQEIGKTRINGDELIILFEEPEIYLHPRLKEKLFESLLKLSEQPNVNVIITTHDPYFIQLSRDKEIFHVLRDSDGATEIKQIEEKTLPEKWRSFAEINYKVFGVNAEDYLNELYGYLESENIKVDDKLSEKESQDNTRKHLGSKKMTLTTCIRHEIHHRSGETKYDDENIKKGKKDMKLSVVIPVYNEIRYIEELIRRVKNINIEKEIIIIDDFSTDGTREILKKIKDNGIRVFFHEKNMGKGAALRTGFKYVTGDMVVIQDADLEYDPQDYMKLICPIIEGKADVVYGSRFLKLEHVFHCKRPFYLTHFFGNKLLNFILGVLYKTNITDMETCYKVMKREVLESIDLSAQGFEIEPEITVSLLRSGFKIHEVPISYVPRDYSEGKKVSWREGVGALFVLFKYRFKKMKQR